MTLNTDSRVARRAGSKRQHRNLHLYFIILASLHHHAWAIFFLELSGIL